jgi:hypothetical protein
MNELYLLTAGGKIKCLRCTAKSTRTKQQCARPALKISRTQKCQFHGGRGQTDESKRLSAKANWVHGQSTNAAKESHRRDSAKLRELEDVMYVLKMASGPKTRGRKPAGYRGVYTETDVARWMRDRDLRLP